MAFDLPFDPAFLGGRLSGDIGGITLYQTRKGKTVAYPASPPKSPPSDAQLSHRIRWRNASKNWTLAAPQNRLDYEATSLRLSLPATGHNLWMHLSFTQSQPVLNVYNAQTGFTLPMPPPV
jgi:hypothetical protein